ncbi:MAG: hypothetical protein STSR0008_02560 [Ignavibacterium sp.]
MKFYGLSINNTDIKNCFFFLLNIDVQRKENVTREDPDILTSNHISKLDAFVIAVTINRRLSAYAKKCVFNSRLKF